MSSHEPLDRKPDEGGLRAPPGLGFWGKAWWWFDFLILVKLARLRFIAILAAIGVVITQWDTLVAHYEKWARPAAGVAAADTGVEYFCPMHPSVIRDNPREKCPICFMPLSKRNKGEQTTEALPAGVVNRVQLSPYRVVLAGVQTWEVAAIPLTKQIEAVGFVEFNERGLKNVSARVKGRLDELFVNETGQMVSQGDVLASLYSPDLNVTMQNLLDARARNRPQLEASARERLRLWDIDDEQIDGILQSGKANTHLQIRSPISGHVIKKYVREGQYVDEGTPLYDVADLSTVWIQAQVYEDDMGFLSRPHWEADPLPVTATAHAFPGEVFRGTLTFVYPHVDQQSRTVTVRFELDNPDHQLRPGTTATVTLLVPPDRVPILKQAAEQGDVSASELSSGFFVAVPESSVIDTGRQTIVYRETLPGTFEGVLATLGPKMTGPDNVPFYPVLEGLARGDRVVTSGSFLVDAETRLNPAAGSIYFGGSSGSSKSSEGTVTTVRPTTPTNEDAKLQAGLSKLVPADREIAVKQRYCPVLESSRLGSMGTPVKLTIGTETVFLCCPACKKSALADPDATLNKVAARKSEPPKPSPSAASQNQSAEAKITAALAKLDQADRRLAEQQRFCVVLPNSRLGSMGPPVKVTIDGQPVFVCCAGCKQGAAAKPQESLRKAERLRHREHADGKDSK